MLISIDSAVPNREIRGILETRGPRLGRALSLLANMAIFPICSSSAWYAFFVVPAVANRASRSSVSHTTIVLWLASAMFISKAGDVFSAESAARSTEREKSRYETREQHDRDGIGKFYMGREISHVMGHLGADWLERPEREEEEQPNLLVKLLKLKPGDAAADIGAGTGYFTRRMAKEVGAAGTIYAVDIQEEMLDLLAKKMAELEITNFKLVLGTENDPKLPLDTLDLVLLVDVYHEFEFPFEMMDAICRSLKTGGRVAFVEYRLEDPSVPIKRLHKMSEAQVKKEAASLPLEWIETIRDLPRQHVIVFRKTKDEN